MLESEQSLQAFQADADKYFSGNIARLVEHYKSNADQVIQDGGQSLETVYLRNKTLTAAYQHFSNNSITPYIHTFLQPLEDVRENTWKGYNFVVLLNTSSIIWAVGIGLFLITLINLFFGLLGAIASLISGKPIKYRKQQLVEPRMGL